MPGRVESILTNYIYHVFNKTLGGFKIFDDERYGQRFLETLRYYRSKKARISLSALKKDLPLSRQQEVWNKVNIKKYFKIKILGYNLMPNHFHLLLYQMTDGGISKVLGDSLNSFTRYFNLLNNKQGPLFLTKFKAVRILTDEQLTHVLRYILLNPYSSGLVDKSEDLINYRHSSFKEHLEDPENRLSTDEYTLPLFDNDRDKFKDFVFSNAEYQRTLEYVKHAERWN